MSLSLSGRFAWYQSKYPEFKTWLKLYPKFLISIKYYTESIIKPVIPWPSPCTTREQGSFSDGPRQHHLKLECPDQAKLHALWIDTMASPGPGMCMLLSLSPRLVVLRAIFVCCREKTQMLPLFKCIQKELIFSYIKSFGLKLIKKNIRRPKHTISKAV